MILTEENYFSVEASKEYMSVSQYKSFKKCEAAALAEVNGEYQRKTTPALLVGSYVDAHFSKCLDIFKAQHSEIFMKSGELKSEYRAADGIIQRIERDEMMMEYLSGEPQIIKTGEIFGVQFKIKMDSYHKEKSIVDLKVMRDFEPKYVEGKGKLSFIEAWGYDLQGAIYQSVEGNKLPFYIAAATKEDVPDIGIFHVPQEYLDLQMEDVRENVIRYYAIKNGDIEPTRCEHCDYCKHTKVLTRVIDLNELQWGVQEDDE